MNGLHDAVGALIRTQTLRIHYLPGLRSAHYTVRAPCLLAQLEAEVGASTGGTASGGRGAATLVASDALDLWVAILTAVHAWARHLGIDRRPYLDRTPITASGAADPEREPGWMRRLAPHLAPVDWAGPLAAPGPPDTGSSPPPPPAPAAHLWRLGLEDTPALADRHVPPVGRLLRAVAATIVERGDERVADAVTRSTLRWADQIRALLTHTGELRALRGMACASCAATTARDERPDGVYPVPALVVRMAVMDGGDPDDRWPYLQCRACGDAGWLTYRTQTPDPHPSEAA